MNYEIEVNVGDVVYVAGEESLGTVASVEPFEILVKMHSDGVTVSCAPQQLSLP